MRPEMGDLLLELLARQPEQMLLQIGSRSELREDASFPGQLIVKDEEVQLEALTKLAEIPVLNVDALRRMLVDEPGDGLLHHVPGFAVQIFAAFQCEGPQ